VQKLSYYQCIPYSLYHERRGTSLSFKSTAGQHSVHAQTSSSFTVRRLLKPNLWL